MDDRIREAGHNRFSFNEQIYSFNGDGRIGGVEPGHNVYVVRDIATGKVICKIMFMMFIDLTMQMVYIEGTPDDCTFVIV